LWRAAEAACPRRYVAQTVCFLYAPEGPPVVDEDAPLAIRAPEPFGSTVRLHAEMERRIVENPSVAGLVLRFGFWYGPGTSFVRDGYTAREVCRRRYPIVGNGAGVFSFVHIDDVVAATIASLDRRAPGRYSICDDEPAPMREWLPVYAEALGAPPPRRVPAWLARLRPAGSSSRRSPRCAGRRTSRPNASWAGSRRTRAGRKASGPALADDRGHPRGICHTSAGAVCRAAVLRRRAAINLLPGEVGRCFRGLVLVDKGTAQLGVGFALVAADEELRRDLQRPGPRGGHLGPPSG
jgi:hypothetical protein